MGFSRLLQAKQCYHFHTIGFTKQTRVYFSTPSKAGCSREQKDTAVVSYARKYMEMYPGIFPKATHVQNEVGGSWYTLKDSLLKLKKKIIGNSQVHSHPSNGDNSNSTADATASTVISSHNNSPEKTRLGEPESAPANPPCNRSDIYTSAVPCISRRTSSENITDAVASETKSTYSSLENIEISKPSSLIQLSEASADSGSTDNHVSHATCSSTEKHSSANMFNTMASEVTRMHDSTDQTKLSEAACRAPLSDIVPNSSSNGNNFLKGALPHLCGDVVKAECVSDRLNVVQSRKEHMEPKELWNKKSRAEQFSCLIHEVTRTLQDKSEYKRASTGCRNQVESKTIPSSFKTNVGSQLGERPSIFDSVEANLAMHKKSKSEQLSCLIEELTGTLPDTTEDKMDSTGCRNQVESKTISSSFKTDVVSELGERPSLFDGDRKLVGFVDCFNKRLDEQPEIKRDNGPLHSEEMPSGSRVSSKADQTTRILQEVVQNISASTGNGHNQLDNQWKVSCISSNVVSEGGGLPASGDDAQKIMQTMRDQEAGQMMTKCNILPPKRILEESNKTIGGNVAKYPNMKILTDCINKLPRGQQVVSTCESIASSRTDQNHTSGHIRGVQSQANMQKFGNEEKQTSSKRQSAKESSMRIGDLNKTQVALSTEALHQYEVIVRFLNKTTEKKDIVAAFRSFGDILKTEVSGVKRNFKIASLYFKTREGMEKALQTIDLIVNGEAVIVEPASLLENMSKKISIPNLIGDPDAPAALVKNPTRTVAVKQLTPEICSRHIKEALTFCESNISGIFLGSSSSVAYVEFETEDGKERALAKFSIDVLGKRLLIFRIDTPRTTVVRISIPNIPGAAKKLNPILKSCGKVRSSHLRCNGIMDVHFSITEWPNMLKILNKLNGMQVMGHQLLAEPASVIPPDVLCELYSQPEERRRLKADMLRLLRKLGENAVRNAKLTKIADKLYGEL